jgi:hypothetical protein
MIVSRIQDLKNKLERNKVRVLAAFVNSPAGHWDRPVYQTPLRWTARDLLAHFVSTEQAMLRVMQDIAAGGRGAPEDFDYDEFNRREQERLQPDSPEELLRLFGRARDATLEWMGGLREEQLDRRGLHPALGEITVEQMLAAVHGHALLHLRDLPRAETAE